MNLLNPQSIVSLTSTTRNSSKNKNRFGTGHSRTGQSYNSSLHTSHSGIPKTIPKTPTQITNKMTSVTNSAKKVSNHYQLMEEHSAQKRRMASKTTLNTSVQVEQFGAKKMKYSSPDANSSMHHPSYSTVTHKS